MSTTTKTRRRARIDPNAVAQKAPKTTQTPAEMLWLIDGWLESSGHGPDHPWRWAIADTLAHVNFVPERPHAQRCRAAPEPCVSLVFFDWDGTTLDDERLKAQRWPLGEQPPSLGEHLWMGGVMFAVTGVVRAIDDFPRLRSYVHLTATKPVGGELASKSLAVH